MATKGVVLLIVGVLLIVAGVSTAVIGMNKQEAAEEWRETKTEESEFCYYEINDSKLPDNFSEIKEEGSEAEIMMAKHEAREKQCDTITPSESENPYSGGGTDVTLGVIVTLIGGVCAYHGTQS